MKIIITALSLLIILASCQKEYTAGIVNESSQTGSTSGSFKAKINSQQFIADKAAGAAFSTAGNGLPRLINISGLSNDKKIITITLEDSGVHKYTIDGNSFHVGLYIDSTLSNTYAFSTEELDAEIAGTVDITSINTVTKTMSGTFSFRAYREMDNSEVNITEGSFTDIPYVDKALPPSASSDTFHVKVNNTLFTPYSISGFALPLNHTIRIQGADSVTVKNVSLSVPDTIAAGTYSMSSFDYYGLYLDGTYSYGSTSGTLTILEHDTAAKRIRGNFDFKAEEPTDSTVSANLTEGYFSVKYQ